MTCKLHIRSWGCGWQHKAEQHMEVAGMQGPVQTGWNHLSLMDPCPGQCCTAMFKAMVDHKWTSCEKAVHLLTALQGQTADIPVSWPQRHMRTLSGPEELLWRPPAGSGLPVSTKVNHLGVCNSHHAVGLPGPGLGFLWISPRGRLPMHSL
jgi:hypothetical protein